MSSTTKSMLIAIAIVLTAQSSDSAQAALVNIANGAPAIGGDANAEGGFLSGGNQATAFKAANATDGQNATPDNDTGALTENFADGSYWLGPTFGTTGYFVLDLGTAYQIGQIVLFNTSNGTPQERGTGNFTVKASNSVTDLGDNGFAPSGFDLSGTIVTLASGTLAAENNPPNTVTPQSFLSNDTTTAYRYIRFDALSVNTIDADNGVGLAEIRLYAVPEPTSFGLLLVGFAGLWRIARKLSN